MAHEPVIAHKQQYKQPEQHGFWHAKVTVCSYTDDRQAQRKGKYDKQGGVVAVTGHGKDMVQMFPVRRERRAPFHQAAQHDAHGIEQWQGDDP